MLVGRIIDGLLSALTYVAMVITTIIMLVTTADALGRYLLNRPITGAMEFTGEYLLVAAVFLAMAYTYRDGVFVRVTLFVSKVSGGARLVVDFIVQALSAAACVVFLYGAILEMQNNLETGATTNSSIGYVLWPAYALVVSGLVLLALLVMIDLLMVHSGKTSLCKREREIVEE